MKTRLSTKGQVVIPNGIREKLALAKDTELEVKVQDDRIILIPVKKNGWKFLRGLLQGKGLTRELEIDHQKEIAGDR